MVREVAVSGVFFVLALIDMIIAFVKKDSPFALRVVTAVVAVACMVLMGTAYTDVFGNPVWTNAPATVLSFVAGDLAMGLGLCAALGVANLSEKPVAYTMVAVDVVLAIGLVLEVMKPISYVDFLQAANKALQWFELVQKPEEIDSIFVKSDYKLVQVDLKKIMYIEGLKDYIKIYTEDAPKPILSLMSMKAMEELLPSSRFIRVHRSFIVQKDKIRVIDRGRIVFDKTYIPISDSYKQVFQTFLDERS